MNPAPAIESAAPLATLRAIPFVRGAKYSPARRPSGPNDDGALDIRTSRGRHRFSALLTRSYLGPGVVNAIVSRVGANHRGRQKAEETIVLAGYVPPAAAEQFLAAGICFVDDPGNVHLRIGESFNWTVLGKRPAAKPTESDRLTPANVQLLFQLATAPESADWPVRDLGRAAGISKTKVAQLRLQFLREGIVAKVRRNVSFQMNGEIGRRLVAGYNDILRPKLVLGRYRAADSSAEGFFKSLTLEARTLHLAYALTGGAAAGVMQRFYHGPEIPLFLPAEAATLRALRLLPDRSGPIVLLKPFGPLIYWREFDGKMVAPPWLVYAELLHSSDPRAIEAAEEFRREYLP